ncbi:MAG: DUF368 domain-containing protein [Candidatus Methanoplasma sp.]|jgi:putative membrane protein|nr:DUF368 domain-containing protein [Candidatus Methanoplasma sp.]
MKSGLSAAKNFIVGALVGITSMLPGISGAVLAVCFGMYERLIGDIAHLRRVWRKEFLFLAMVGLGILAGMFLAAFALDFLLEKHRLIAIFLSAGLIVGQTPMLYRRSGTLGNMGSSNWAALVIGAGIAVVFLILNINSNAGSAMSVDELMSKGLMSYLYMIFIGLILAIAKLIPGISGATVLLAIGLMDPLTSGMTHFDMKLLMCVGFGLIVGMLIFSKAVDHALKNWNRSTYILILGLTVGSTAIILYDGAVLVSGAADAATAAVTFAIGLIASLLMVWIGDRTAERKDSRPDAGGPE